MRGKKVRQIRSAYFSANAASQQLPRFFIPQLTWLWLLDQSQRCCPSSLIRHMPSLKGQSLSTCPTSSLRPKDAGRPPGFRQIGNDRNGCHKGFGLIHVNSINTPKNDRTITEDQNAECCRHVGNQNLNHIREGTNVR